MHYIDVVQESSVANQSLYQRTRAAVREEVVAVAVALFVERGFDAVTTGQIAAAAGISPRSFFRYFATKEDVILGTLYDSGRRVRDALVQRPADEGPWDALRHALHALADHPVYPSEHLEAMARLILDTPSLRTRDLQKYQEWEVLLVPNIAQRLLRSGSLPRTDVHDAARSIVGAAVAALRVATERWLHSHGLTDPTAVLDELIAVVRTA